MSTTINISTQGAYEGEAGVGDESMLSLICREQYDLGLLELDRTLKPLSDVLDASEQLTVLDYRLRISVPTW